MLKKVLLFGAIILGLAILLGAGCAKPGATTTTPPPSVNYTETQLKYLLIKEFGTPFFVDTDFYPIAREGIEEQHAVEQFPSIRANAEEFTAILAQLGLPDKTEYSINETIAIYREHKMLTLGIQLTASGDLYNFSLRIGENQGEHIAGTITKSGKITVTLREPSFNTYPICLAAGTLIDTPQGPVLVESLRPGTAVWTLDAAGRRVSAPIIKTVSTPVTDDFRVVKVILSDGRTVTASPGHPTADNRALGDYKAGDLLDGAVVVSAERITYGGGHTYDILPDSATGTYRADGILLKSTLTR